MLRPNFFPEFDRNDNCDGDHGYVDDHPNPDTDHNQLTDEQLRHRATWKDIWLQAKKYEAVSWLCLNCWYHTDFILISDLDKGSHPFKKVQFFLNIVQTGGGQPMFKNYVGNCRVFWRSFNNMKFAWKGTFEALMVKFGGEIGTLYQIFTPCTPLPKYKRAFTLSTLSLNFENKFQCKCLITCEWQTVSSGWIPIGCQSGWIPSGCWSDNIDASDVAHGST